MFKKNRLSKSDAIAWVRGGRGGPGYEDRALGRVIRTGTGRVTILVFRAADQDWVIRSVGANELEPATSDELAKLEALERADHRAAA